MLDQLPARSPENCLSAEHPFGPSTHHFAGRAFKPGPLVFLGSLWFGSRAPTQHDPARDIILTSDCQRSRFFGRRASDLPGGRLFYCYALTLNDDLIVFKIGSTRSRMPHLSAISRNRRQRSITSFSCRRRDPATVLYRFPSRPVRTIGVSDAFEVSTFTPEARTSATNVLDTRHSSAIFPLLNCDHSGSFSNT